VDWLAVAVAVALAACEAVPSLSFVPADGAPAPEDAATAVDGGAEASDSTDAAGVDVQGALPCGDVGPCDFSTSTCCLTKLGFDCILRGTSCGGIDLLCHDGDDCAGNKVCCASLGDGGDIKKLSCSAGPPCTNGGGAVACDLEAGGCTTGTCTPSSVDGYGICQ
jgi:hypothetical protein